MLINHYIKDVLFFIITNMNIYWYCPNSVMADFEDPMDNPSFRLRCHSIHKRLLRDGFNSKIVDRVELINDPHIVVLMSFGESEYLIAEQVTKWGGAVIHDYCENIRGIPILEKTKELCKYIICCSTWLQREEAKTYRDKVLCIKDPIELNPIMHNPSFKRDKMRVAWSGMGGNASFVETALKPIVESNGMDYIEISNRPNSTIQWSKEWAKDLASCDVALCPQSHWSYPAKSNVKVTTAMSLGLPVIASPIESYLEVIDTGMNGYIAYSLEDWDNYLKQIKKYRPAKCFYENSESILKKYHPETIYSNWLKVFKRCLE